MFYDIDFEGYLQIKVDDGTSKEEAKDIAHDLLYEALYRLSSDGIHVKVTDIEKGV